MVSPSAKEIFIQGITSDGRTFRPSDWAERLAGVMCSFRPGGATPGKPVGTVWMAVAQSGGATRTELLNLAGDRSAVREQTVAHALRRLLERA